MSSWGTIYNNAMWGVSFHTSSLARIQEQISTGSKVIRFSDDPANASRISTLVDTAKSLEEYSGNINEVEMSLNEADGNLTAISDLVIQVTGLLTQASSDLYKGNRPGMAETLDEILEQMVGLVNNSKVLGRYIFGGTDSKDPPYTVTRENGRISSIRYEGSYLDQPVPVAPGVTFSGQLVGDRIFREDQRQDPVFKGNTGVAGGVGTSNARGYFWLDVTHTTTDFNTGATGLVGGTSSAASDTILGTHSVTIDTADKTITLDGGGAVSYVGTETDLQLTNSSGDIAYVNTTGVLVNGAFNITGNGELSINGGPATAIDFNDDNISVTGPEADQFLYVDGRSVFRTGTEAVGVPGTHDLFNALIHARDMVLNTKNLPDDGAWNDSITQASESLNDVNRRFQHQRTVIGGRLGGLDQLRRTLENMQFNNTSEASSLQDADIVELAMELARTQVLYQASLLIAGKTLSLSLLDYIR